MAGNDCSFCKKLFKCAIQGHVGTLVAVCGICAALLVGWVLTMGEDEFRSLFVALTCINGAVLGSAAATLVNVFVFRLPRKLPLIKPWHSICPSCRNRLKIIDMLPVVGFLMIRGRCRSCGLRIPFRYLLLELVLGAMWTMVWYVFLVVSWRPFEAAAATLLTTCTVGAICFFVEQRNATVPVLRRSMQLPTSG